MTLSVLCYVPPFVEPLGLTIPFSVLKPVLTTPSFQSMLTPLLQSNCVRRVCRWSLQGNGFEQRSKLTGSYFICQNQHTRSCTVQSLFPSIQKVTITPSQSLSKALTFRSPMQRLLTRAQNEQCLSCVRKASFCQYSQIRCISCEKDTVSCQSCFFVS